MKLNRRRRIIGASCLSAFFVAVIFVLGAGYVLVLPSNHPVGNPPADLKTENVEFSSASGAVIHGWFVAGLPGHGAVVLMHGVHGDRMSLVRRAELLSKTGYAVLLFDFQAHGESAGKQITYGYLESRDASAAVDFIRRKLPGEKIAVIGVSLGAASALLAKPVLPVNAMVLESSYPTIYQATEDRLVARFGWLGRLGAPLLVCQLKPRLGIGLDDLKPVERAREIPAPKFFIAGTADRNTTIEESKAMFACAAGPKQSWWLEGAGHQDLYDFAQGEYEERVLAFLAEHLK